MANEFGSTMLSATSAEVKNRFAAMTTAEIVANSFDGRGIATVMTAFAASEPLARAGSSDVLFSTLQILSEAFDDGQQFIVFHVPE
jgi:hypothetical protein